MQVEKIVYFVFGVWCLGGYCMWKRILVCLLFVYVGQFLCVSNRYFEVIILNSDLIFSFGSCVVQ